ncbi:MAG: hypothetical protein CMF39_02515 [Legionellaceae bacterium]|nr:hypothetical protein [Legionellaceae bacterium]
MPSELGQAEVAGLPSARFRDSTQSRDSYQSDGSPRRDFAKAVSPSDDDATSQEDVPLIEFVSLDQLGERITAQNIDDCIQFLKQCLADSSTDQFEPFFEKLMQPFYMNYPGVNQCCSEKIKQLNDPAIEQSKKIEHSLRVLDTCKKSFVGLMQGEWRTIDSAEAILARGFSSVFGTPTRRLKSNGQRAETPQDIRFRKQHAYDAERFVWKLTLASQPGQTFKHDPERGFALLINCNTGETTDILTQYFSDDVLEQLSKCVTQTSTELVDFYRIWQQFIDPLHQAEIRVALADKNLAIHIEEHKKTIRMQMHYWVVIREGTGTEFIISNDSTIPFLDFWCAFTVIDGAWTLVAKYQDNTPDKKFESVLAPYFAQQAENLKRTNADSPPLDGSRKPVRMNTTAQLAQQFQPTAASTPRPVARQLNVGKSRPADVPLVIQDPETGELLFDPGFIIFLRDMVRLKQEGEQTRCVDDATIERGVSKLSP